MKTSLVGQTVRWEAELVSVSREGEAMIEFPTIKLSEEEAKLALAYPAEKSDYTLVWEPKFPEASRSPRGAKLGGVTSPDREWLATLRKGDRVVVAGTITQVSLRHAHVGEYARPAGDTSTASSSGRSTSRTPP